MRHPDGTRVKVIGDLKDWTRIAQENLYGETGTVLTYKPDWNFHGEACLVKMDRPIKLNPISTATEVWIPCENLWLISCPKETEEETQP